MRQPGRRHVTGAKLPDDLFPRFRVLAYTFRADRVERESCRFQFVVVTSSTVPIDDRTFGRNSGGLLRTPNAYGPTGHTQDRSPRADPTRTPIHPHASSENVDD